MPPKRKKPDDRRQAIDERDEAVFTNFLSDDIISTYDDFVYKLSVRLCDAFTTGQWIKQHLPTTILIFTVEKINCVPCLALCIRVDNTLSVTVFVAGKQVNNRRLQWILPTGDKLERWSQLETMISHYGSKDDTTEATDKASEYIIEIDKACSILKQVYEDMTQTDDVISGDLNITCLLFCIEQLRLLCIPCFRRRYISDLLRFAYVLCLRSSSCYSVLYKLGYVILPHKSTLRKLVGATGVTTGVSGEDHAKYLELVASKLSDREKYVILQSDEIHVRAGYSYKGSSIVEAASNVSHEAAQTVQAFMISSLFGASKEIVSIIDRCHLHSTKCWFYCCSCHC